jgi:hypothetical protein
MRIIDPPSGWKYGFPKALPDTITESEIAAWLLEQGYPEQLLDIALRYSRIWDQDIPQDENCNCVGFHTGACDENS